MRRRVREPAGSAPARLLRFDPADWPDDACHPECAYWAAVQDWDHRHPGEPGELVDPPAEPWHPERI